MLPRTKLALLAALSLTAAACGLKGPLYRPDEARNESVTPANPAAPASTETPKKKDTPSSSVPGETSEPGVSPPDPDGPVVPPDR
jgi:predicted small lipoprotein YifL